MVRWPILSWKAQYSLDLGSFRFCGSGRLGCLRLAFDGVIHMVNGNPEWNEVGLFSAILVRVRSASG